MNKIRLALEDLEVDSFATEAKPGTRGTVVGMQTGVGDCGWSFIGTTCGNSVWEAGCSDVTAALDCAPTEGGYAWCQSGYAWCASGGYAVCTEI